MTATAGTITPAPKTLWGLLCLALVPWLLVRIQQATNSDMLWLSEALHRYFSGGSLSHVAYEGNPPLSLLIYTLPVLGQSWFGLPLHYTIFLQSVAVVFISAWATYRILSAWGILQAQEIYLVVAAYLLVNTIGASLYFGERDQLIGAVLMPLVLMQWTMTFNLPQARGWKWPVLIAGSVAVLLKPHYGLLPSLMLLHRVIHRRSLSPLKDVDFIALASLTLGYLAIIFVAFPDYVRVIMPDVMRLYVPAHPWKNVADFILLTGWFCMAFAIAAAYMKMAQPAKKLTLLMFLAATICLIPYYVQGLGFYYHTLPTLSFMAPGVALVILAWLSTQAGREIPVFFTAIMMIIFAYLCAPLNTGYPRHQDYAQLPLSRLLERNCPQDKPCSFFMFNQNMGIIHETAYYTGIHHASRFPSLWFLPAIVKSKDATDIKKYTTMVTEDFTEGKPDIVVLWRPGKEFGKFDFVQFFSADKNFAREWKHYRKDQNLTLSYSDYFKGTAQENESLNYDVYKRVK